MYRSFKDMSVIRKSNHFSIYDYDYEESWLNDLVSDGLVLTGEGIRGYEFEQSDNLGRRCRVCKLFRRTRP